MASKVYLLHYLGEIGDTTKPTGYAQHYLGSTRRSLKQRLAEHAAGRGAKITAAFARQNIDFICVRTWNGGRTVERYLKRVTSRPSLSFVQSQRPSIRQPDGGNTPDLQFQTRFSIEIFSVSIENIEKLK
ncbi:MAG: hypothetical protein EWV49_21880 [Microcystis aeruginosa Ma_QC_Ch_20071001_S25]|uniref:GIY-YIG domain-containing protein n=2 Tax=Microcystis aeruginosa TaxID=1126 RepID=A0A552FW22_MICAE|nr:MULTISPECIES: GIY-YIG nuclease family protein [unclassified Microcystis]NCS47556.1 GIY-YIG nuclease family protein [Microcystis aeruginosa BK11-02]NCS51786.1 GIY-YIG nuclease family protein [Microcystis aeruginosa G13-05]TRT86474.1 MAG: hypothetical protein EWV82_05575 [Microcystis aeruginosa Ma_AC_P_19900807_S299]TRU19604.1 MAG: hypothetical protein EWV81_23735 [Microcystis aeruginosa Ma_SC_T_19800800_S464]TRU43846.1 MAG: hypothetical protein EWV49_21880 [Microcystis aeruginosa Ma_QC_Ch_20